MITPNITSYSPNKLQSMNLSCQPKFKGDTSKQEIASLRDELKKEGVELPLLTPLQAGVLVGSFSFLGFLAFDRLLGKVIKSFSYPMKYALAVNGIIGIVSGVQAYLREKKNASKVG